MALTETVPARDVAQAGRKRLRIDWKRGATLLIDGETPTAVCAALGIDEDRLWRHLRGSLRFQYLLRQARERRRLLGQLRFEAVGREAAVRLAHCAEKPEAALIAELAGAGNGTGNDTGTGETQDERRDVIARLADSGRRPPNQAFRKRLAVERRQMDAEFEDHCRAVRAHEAARAMTQPADTPAEPENKTQISGNKTQLNENKSRFSANSVETGAATIAPHSHRPERRVPQPQSPQSSSLLPPGLQGGGIVDLTDMQGNPLVSEDDRPARARRGYPAQDDGSGLR